MGSTGVCSITSWGPLRHLNRSRGGGRSRRPHVCFGAHNICSTPLAAMRAQHACPPAPATCLAPAAARRSHLLPPARPACPKPQPQPHSQLHPAAASTLLPHPATSHARERRRRHHATRAGGANGTVGAAPSPPGPLGVVIVDHGSRKAASNDMLVRVWGHAVVRARMRMPPRTQQPAARSSCCPGSPRAHSHAHGPLLLCGSWTLWRCTSRPRALRSWSPRTWSLRSPPLSRPWVGARACAGWRTQVAGCLQAHQSMAACTLHWHTHTHASTLSRRAVRGRRGDPGGGGAVLLVQGPAHTGKRDQQRPCALCAHPLRARCPGSSAPPPTPCTALAAVRACPHAQEDIPALVQAAQAKYPGVQCIIADPIGVWAAAAVRLHGWVGCTPVIHQVLLPPHVHAMRPHACRHRPPHGAAHQQPRARSGGAGANWGGVSATNPASRSRGL